MSNFSNLDQKWQPLAQTAMEAERQVYQVPVYAAMLCRKSLEEWIRWMYEHDQDLELPYDTSLNSLIHNEPFKALIYTQFHQINLIRKIGNQAVHVAGKVTSSEALSSLKILHGFINWVVLIYSPEKPVVGKFDEALIPKGTETAVSKIELEHLEHYFVDAQKLIKALQAELDQVKSAKENNKDQVPPPVDPNEDLTRKLYINILLKEAGWDPKGPNVPEFRVTGMPRVDGSTGEGFVDYVLWGNDGIPLALVEAKRTMHDSRIGQNQAKLYADCLEKEYNRRPLIYFSNGFETWFWDDLNYPPRPVYGFHTRDEHQMLINRRYSAKDLRNEPINKDITDRYYQIEAIRSTTEAFERRAREALLVMATGTGKTRTAAALVDLLSKASWCKRVLFLADRNALVRQAKNAFNNYLPNLPAIDLTKEKEDESSRIVFSTYQTLIHQIDGEFIENTRFYGIGHFDVVIFDEIHRSVYNKYKVIFQYFDALKIGLTATPASMADRDTYELFGLETHNPTFAYELEKAVSDHFLVPYKAHSVPTKFQRKGIKYGELSEEEKLRYEEEFADPLTGEFPDEIDATALNEWLFNADTVDKVIGCLMEHGIRVDGGDKLGKTIIFARNHRHAIFIEERFNIQYPGHKGHFLRVIDNYETYAYDLLMKFSDKDQMPQIAVSVDMLDTGIDIPELVNLAFLKPVRSSIKFWQMIGRGTRLCKDLFASGIDKSQFLIFDFCENFEFFGINPQGVEPKSTKSISQKIFETRLKLALLLKAEKDIDLQHNGNELFNFLIHQTGALNQDSFIVRQHWRIVEKYRDPNAWNALNEQDIRDIFHHIAPLIEDIDSEELAKRFDLLMLDLQYYILLSDNRQNKLTTQVKGIGSKLSKKGSIPAIAQQMDLLISIQSDEYWQEVTIPGLETLRVEIRELIKFLEKESRPIVYTDFKDEIGEWVIHDQTIQDYVDLSTYKKRVERFLKEHENFLVIQKLKTNLPITRSELESLEDMLFGQGKLGTKEDIKQVYGDQPLGKFVRSIVGLDVTAARSAFVDFLNNAAFNSQQIRFIDKIINFLTVNGTIDPGMLFETPFTDINSKGLTGLFDDSVSREIIRVIERINGNVVAA